MIKKLAKALEANLKSMARGGLKYPSRLLQNVSKIFKRFGLSTVDVLLTLIDEIKFPPLMENFIEKFGASNDSPKKPNSILHESCCSISMILKYS